MKIRLMFISNSSSSSFLCEVTGRIKSGMDVGLDDVDMAECVNGHIFSDYLTTIEKYEDENEYGEYSNRYNIPETECPLCTLRHVSCEDALKYAEKRYDLSNIRDEISNRFSDLEQLKLYLKG